MIRSQYEWYIETMGYKAAAKFRQGILDDAQRLGANPELGRVEEWLTDRSLGNIWRSFVSGRRYKIVYFFDHQQIDIAYVWDCKKSPSTLGSIIKKSR